jgi:glycerol-3-phosphate acyltransferase PlsX
MGGDRHPQVEVEGVIDALAEYSDVVISLVGRVNQIDSCVENIAAGHGSDHARMKVIPRIKDRLVIVNADEVIEMGDSPSHAIRAKKNSSIAIASKMCRTGEVHAVISAGNTGAVMASSLLYIGRLTGVSRPAITALFPAKKNPVAMLDLGANTDCKPEHLYQFGVMGSIYVSHVFGIDRPRVGLLNIGEERGKGNELTDGAYELFERSNLNFIGNVEGRDIFDGIADVVVCDGFVGNVLLKFGESIFGFITTQLKKKVARSPLLMAGGYLLKPALKELKQDMTSEEYGGAQLLGIDGVVIICHGNSTPLAIKNAVKVARQLVIEDVNEQIKQTLEKKTA